jgi:hypothetical protein
MDGFGLEFGDFERSLRRFGLPGPAWTGCVLRLRERERVGLFECGNLEWSVNDRKRVSGELFGRWRIERDLVDGHWFERERIRREWV